MPATNPEHKPLLQIQGLKKYYPVKGARRTAVRAVDGVDLTLYQGEALGLVGESGCGKSTIARQIVGLEQPTQGAIYLQGKDLSTLKGAQARIARLQRQMVFQDPYSSLNERKTVGDILSQPLLYHRLADRGNVVQEVERLLALVGLPQDSRYRYPHEFSGGQRQRIGIARALSLKPKLIVCDEPVSALDVSIQAQILNLLKSLQAELGLTYVFIAHGLGAVRYVSDRIAVMYLGKIVELAPAGQLFEKPLHPYTQALCDAVPAPDPRLRDRERVILTGEVPLNTTEHTGCRFRTRCPRAMEICASVEPPLAPVDGQDGRQCACHLVN